MLLYLRPAHVFVQTYAVRYKYKLQNPKKRAKYDDHWMLWSWRLCHDSGLQPFASRVYPVL